ncbi:hypothetical protein VNO77_39189 [Canavalia gladiata]|uniref:Uncharacterized protein n=1 Tax=Canavalia gladiata TaxID=3824 RepID=A0AAN9PXJ8_CANGL
MERGVHGKIDNKIAKIANNVGVKSMHNNELNSVLLLDEYLARKRPGTKFLQSDCTDLNNGSQSDCTDLNNGSWE